MSSIHYFPKTRFVKAKDSDSNLSAINKDNSKTNSKPSSSDGKGARNFYESLFVSSSSSEEDDEVQIVNEISHTQKKYTPKDLFSAVDKKDSDGIEQMINQNVDMNVVDSYGWTPLMHAVASGSIEIAHLLLSKGANPAFTRDKAGWSCLSLAQKEGGPMFQLISSGPSTSSSSSVEEGESSFDCDICHESFTDGKKVHCSSIVHNFRFNNHPDASRPKSTSYGISENNRGYELMLKKGWDPEKGLGPSGTGKLYPVKTILKKDRSGIGRLKERARITHFGPGDVNSIANFRSKANHHGRHFPNKKAMRRKLALEKQKTANFRRELSDL